MVKFAVSEFSGIWKCNVMKAEQWKWWYTAALASSIGCACYLNTLDADFVYDDSRAIQKNADLLSTTPWVNLLYNDFWGTPLTHSGSHKSYRPICVASFRLNHAVSGLNAQGYHLVNATLHGVVCWLFVMLCYALLQSHVPSLIGGLLFATHPIHTEAVAGVVGRADVGACMFFIAALLAYIKSCPQYPTGSPPHGYGCKETSWGWLMGSLVLSAASMLTKEQGITVLGVCVVYEVITVSRLNCTTLRLSLQKAIDRGFAVRLLSLAVTGASLLVLRMVLMGNAPPEFSPSDNPAASSDSLVTRTLTFVYLPVFNFLLLLCPITLSFDWSMEAIPLIQSILDSRNLISVSFYVLFVGLGVLCLKRTMFDELIFESKTEKNGNDKHFSQNGNGATTSTKNGFNGSRKRNNLHTQKHIHIHQRDRRKREDSKRRPETEESVADNKNIRVETFNFQALLTSFAILVLPFIPACNIFFYVGFVVAERVLYIPSVGFCIIIAIGVDVLWRKHGCGVRKVIGCVVFIVLVLFSMKTVQRNLDWADEETLYRSGIHVNPAKAWGNLGNVLGGQNRISEAEHAYRKALSYRSNMADTHYNLGILLAGQKRYKEAIKSYEHAITFRPRLAVAHLNLGIVLDQIGLKEDAVRILKNATSISGHGLKDPKQHSHAITSIKYNLGRVLTDLGRLEESLRVYHDAVKTRPAHFEPHSLYNMIGETYTKASMTVEAEKWYKKSLQAKPDHVPAHLTLAKLLSKTGRVKQAEALFKKAQILGPRDSSVWTHYGQHLYEYRKISLAADMFLKAIELTPDDFDIVFNTANYLRESGRYEKAEDCYRKSVILNPQSNIAHMNLGAILHVLGKLEESEKHYLKALKLNPGDSMTQDNLKKLRSLMVKRNSK